MTPRGGEDREDVQLTIRLERDTVRRLKAIANVRNGTLAGLMRIIVESYLKLKEPEMPDRKTD